MTPHNESQRAIRRHLLTGLLVGTLLFAGLGGWAYTTQIAGAVVASGVVVVDSDVKKVQHPTGGIVGELNVRKGDRVDEGQIIVRLDETQTKANLAVFTKSLDDLYARQARLEAERNGTDALAFAALLLERSSDPEVARIIDGERKLFELRVTARAGQKAQLRRRVDQLREEVSGLEEQIRSKTEELSLIDEELKGVTDLWNKKLVPLSRVTALKRDKARIDGERGQLIASKASTAGKISEIELQIIQVDEDSRSEVAEELSEVHAKIAELSERKIAAEDQLKHTAIRAPQSGRVHELAVHTVGGVIAPGETIMLIVPENDALGIEARVTPNDIDQLHPDQPAHVRFSAFNQRVTPELEGAISWISPELTQDEHTGVSYYTARVVLPEAQLQRLKGLKVIPGMPVEAFIETGQRTVLSYLLKPLSDQIMRSFRED